MNSIVQKVHLCFLNLLPLSSTFFAGDSFSGSNFGCNLSPSNGSIRTAKLYCFCFSCFGWRPRFPTINTRFCCALGSCCLSWKRKKKSLNCCALTILFMRLSICSWRRVMFVFGVTIELFFTIKVDVLFTWKTLMILSNLTICGYIVQNWRNKIILKNGQLRWTGFNRIGLYFLFNFNALLAISVHVYCCWWPKIDVHFVKVLKYLFSTPHMDVYLVYIDTFTFVIILCQFHLKRYLQIKCNLHIFHYFHTICSSHCRLSLWYCICNARCLCFISEMVMSRCNCLTFDIGDVWTYLCQH